MALESDCYGEGMFFDMFAPELIDDPYPLYARLREAGVGHYRLPGSPKPAVTVLGRYSDVQAVLRDHRFGRAGFTEYAAAALGDGPLARSLVHWMLFRDPPDHTRLRTLLGKAFTPRAIEGIGDKVSRGAEQLLEGDHGTEQLDLVSAFAYPLPVLAICELLGIPEDDQN